jgi:hypothetical protein
VIDRTSRYHAVETATHQVDEGGGGVREIRYLRRRLLPAPASRAEVVAEHTVAEGDRLDNVTARYLDDPLQFWRVADANGALHPDELTERAGIRIKIALPRL